MTTEAERLADEIERVGLLEVTAKQQQIILAALRRSTPQEGEPVLPCEVVVASGHFSKGVKVSTLQGAITRLYDHTLALESQLGIICYQCKLAILPGELSVRRNVAPHAASGGTMMTFHSECPEPGFGRLLAAATATPLMLTASPAPESAPSDWREVALAVGERLASTGPNGYYDMTAGQWREWALSALSALPPEAKNGEGMPA